LTFSEEEATAIEEQVTPFIVANSLYSEKETQNAQQDASNNVKEITNSYIEGQAIVLRGQIITPEQYEALQFFGFIKPENRVKELIATSLLVLLLAGYVVIYFTRRRISLIDDLRSLTLIAISFLVFLFAARAVIPNRTILPYLFPIPAFALIIACLFNLETSIIFSLVLKYCRCFWSIQFIRIDHLSI
jgi:membrane-associated HD superfamily phosphohydrolase